MLAGPNGDLWVDLFETGKELTRDDLAHLYKVQGLSILENKEHLKDKNLVLVAMDIVKNDLHKFRSIYKALPNSLQEDMQLKDFYQ